MDIGREVGKLYAKAFPEVLKAHGELYVRSGAVWGTSCSSACPA